MEQEKDQNKQKKRRTAIIPDADNSNQIERIGLWVGLGLAALTTIGVLSLSFYINYKGAHTDQSDAQASAVAASQQGAIPASEAEAASMALTATKQQSQGMTAPADENTAASGAETATASTPAQSILAEQAAADAAAKVVVENGVVKFYFASGKAELAPNSQDALKGVVEGVHAGKKAVVSGYTDSSGNAELNAKLSKERAFAVRDALLSAGVPESSIEMKKPESSTGSGDKTEARRVEVVLQ